MKNVISSVAPYAMVVIFTLLFIWFAKASSVVLG